MAKTLAELQALCTRHGIAHPHQRRPAKDQYLRALRDHLWNLEHPGQPLPEQIEPMLLGEWNDLDENIVGAIEPDQSGWCIQEKLDGVRVLLHITAEGVRVTGRNLSEVNFRLTEFTNNLPHLKMGFENLVGTILDGELICPQSIVETGETITDSSLQATVAILAAAPEKAVTIQVGNNCWLQFVAFDVIRFKGEDTAHLQLRERLRILETAFLTAENPHLDMIETHTEEKALYHELLIAEGKEGSVWKRLDQPYQAGKRVKHSLKRKKALEVVATVTGFKAGTTGKGNADVIGAVEFSVTSENGESKPIAWVSSWSNEERLRMTRNGEGIVSLNEGFYGKKALIGGHDIAGKSGRMRHAKLIRWLDAA